MTKIALEGYPTSPADSAQEQWSPRESQEVGKYALTSSLTNLQATKSKSTEEKIQLWRGGRIEFQGIPRS